MVPARSREAKTRVVAGELAVAERHDRNPYFFLQGLGHGPVHGRGEDYLWFDGEQRFEVGFLVDALGAARADDGQGEQFEMGQAVGPAGLLGDFEALDADHPVRGFEKGDQAQAARPQADDA